MIHLLRAFLTIIRSLFMKKLKLLDQSNISCFVWLFDAHRKYVGQVLYPAYFEFGRWNLLVRNGMAKLWIKHGWVGLVTSQFIRYKKPLQRWQRFKVTTEILGWDKKTFFIKQTLTRKGQLHAAAIVKGAFAKKGEVLSPAKVMQIIQEDAPTSNMPEGLETYSQIEHYLWKLSKEETNIS